MPCAFAWGCEGKGAPPLEGMGTGTGPWDGIVMKPGCTPPPIIIGIGGMGGIGGIGALDCAGMCIGWIRPPLCDAALGIPPWPSCLDIGWLVCGAARCCGTRTGGLAAPPWGMPGMGGMVGIVGIVGIGGALPWFWPPWNIWKNAPAENVDPGAAAPPCG